MALAEVGVGDLGNHGFPARPRGGAPEIPSSNASVRLLAGDRIDISDAGRGLAGNAAPTADEGVAPDSTGGLLQGGVHGLIQNALQTMREELSQVLHAFGLDAEAVATFAREFIEPVVAALKSGSDFHAELSFSAFSEVTQVSESSFSQETSLLARSLEIDVNHATGEVAVTFASLSVEQEIFVVQSGTDAPFMGVAPGFIVPPPAPASDDEREGPIERLLEEAREDLAAVADRFRSSIRLDALEQFVDEAGDPHSKLTFQVATPVADEAVANPQEESTPESIDVTA